MTDMQQEPDSLASKVIASVRSYFLLTACFFILVLCLRAYEWTAVASIRSLPTHVFTTILTGLIDDLLFCLNVSIMFLVPAVALGIWLPTVARVLVSLVYGTLLVIHIALIQYYLTANIPLGSDLFGYSWKEIQFTVHSSTGITLWTFIPFVLSFLIAWFLFQFLKRWNISLRSFPWIGGVLILSVFVSLIYQPATNYSSDENQFYSAVNKSVFFYGKTWDYLTASTQTQTHMRPYPMYRTIAYKNVLGPFLKQAPGRPNLVFIIVEGLGRDFVGPNATYGGFTPFIDSLTQHSLYWENFLSTAGRTFNALPSIFGSLPYGKNGFMEMGGQMPYHLTLLSILNQQGYHTNFFYGSDANFDLMDVFLDRQGTAVTLDQEKFGAGYHKAALNEQGFSWGYDDGDMFTRAMELLSEQTGNPRLDIYLTITTHEPFSPPNKAFYDDAFQKRLATLSVSDAKRKVYLEYKDVFSTLIYFDTALRNLFAAYRQRADYGSTIFFVTGDHRLIPIPLGEQIDRFHIPLIIASPLVREPQTLSSISTHSDITPTVLALLHDQYAIDIPAKASWLSTGLDTARTFRNIHSMPLMRNKNELIDYIDGTYHLAGERVFQLLPGMDEEPIQNDSLQSLLQAKLKRFKQINAYVCEQKRLYPDSVKGPQYLEFSAEDRAQFALLKLDTLNDAQLFERARTEAFQQRYDDARLLCRKILAHNPLHNDTRLLLGRTYAWDKQYDIARSMYNDVLHRMPDNTDALSALIDLQLWSGNDTRALVLADSCLKFYPGNMPLLVRKVKALVGLNRTREAKTALLSVLKSDPHNEEAAPLKHRLGL